MHRKRIAHIFISVFLASIPILSIAQSTEKIQSNEVNELNQKEEQLVSILNHSGLDNLKATLVDIVNEETERQHHFFVAKYDNEKDYSYMYWLEGNMLWTIFIGGDTMENWEHLRYPTGGQCLDLDSDVVATENGIGGSTYLTTRDWAADKVYSAVVEGDLIIVNF